jgi:hypothetical protein
MSVTRGMFTKSMGGQFLCDGALAVAGAWNINIPPKRKKKKTHTKIIILFFLFINGDSVFHS